MARSPEDYEAEIAALRDRVERLERGSRPALLGGSILGTGPGTVGRLTLPGLEEMVLLVQAANTVGYMNQPMARVLGVEDRKAAIGQPVARLDQGPLGEGTLQGICEIVRAGAPGYVLERACPELPIDRVPTRHGRRPAGDPVVRISGELHEGRVQLVVQDVTRLRWLERTFARYVSAQVIENLEKRPIDEHLGMVRKELTVLFGDLRGFTRISQALPPDGVQELVNAFMDLVGDELEALGGTIVSWMGDGVMAVFGAPLYSEDHALRALVAAVELQGAQQRWAVQRSAAGLPAPPLGLGLATGEVAVGNVGSAERLCYTALGHTTNMAARLCGRAEGGQILTTPETHQTALGSLHSYSGTVPVPRLSFRAAGPMSFKNVAEPVSVVEVSTKRDAP